jgi:hypothetical protein
MYTGTLSDPAKFGLDAELPVLESFADVAGGDQAEGVRPAVSRSPGRQARPARRSRGREFTGPVAVGAMARRKPSWEWNRPVFRCLRSWPCCWLL